MMKKSTKSLLVLLSLFSLLIFAVGCGKQEAVSSKPAAESKGALAKIKEKGVLVVGSSNDTPFAFIDKDSKEFTGIDAEIITEIAKRLGIPKVEMKEVKFENLLIELNNNNIDMVTDGMYIKPEREKIAAFTNPWYKEAEALIVRKDSTIKGIDDLQDKVVGGQKGTTFLQYVEELKTQGKIKEVKIFGSQAELLLALNTQKLDAVISDSATSAYTIQHDPSLSIKLVSPYKAKYDGLVGSSVRKGDKDLLDAVNAELDKLKQEGFVLNVLKKYGLNEDNVVPVK